MTRMSEAHPSAGSRISHNCARSLKGSALAHGVHTSRPLVRIVLSGLLTSTTGCLISPSLSVENQDAGVNSPPVILGVRSDDQELPTIEASPVIFTKNEGTLSVELIDSDLGDTLFVRAFVDYTVDDPKSSRMFCTAPANGKAERTVSCAAGTICTDAEIDPNNPDKTFDLYITVFDREPLDAGNPPFQAMPEGGLSTNRYYKLQCRAAQ
jgi:hypothetical protein